MKTVSSALLAHLQGDVQTVAHCLKLTRVDGTILGFTEHDKDIILDGVTYEAATGANLSALSASFDLSVDNFDIDTLLDSVKITAADIYAGLYDFAEWSLFLVNYKDLTQGSVYLSRGWIGEVDYGMLPCKAEARSLYDALSQQIIDLVSPDCMADLGDVRCGVNLTPLTVTGTVTAVTADNLFIDTSRVEIDGWFTDGKLTWTSGNNNGRTIEIKNYSSDYYSFLLFTYAPHPIQVGDTYSVYPGCNKWLSTCITKFNNVNNFRGFPYLPGLAKLLAYEIP